MPQTTMIPLRQEDREGWHFFGIALIYRQHHGLVTI
ncbi:hypothetical protein BOS5A_230902 [Bosea sp. EC-HK365B]|nr:hypothetical protein BOS5A_230902 [Bosea sp. EC-HK365B]